MFLISGITGKVGGATARHLLAQGRAVRALVRDPQKAAGWAARGVELRQGDLADPAAVAGALDGVEGAYFMLPPVFAPAPDFPEAHAVIASFQDALRQAPPPRLALLSSFGSERASGLGLITSTHLLETALDNLPVPAAILRPGGFYENYAAMLPSVAATGVSYSFYHPLDRAIPMVATEDIGAAAARLLAGPAWDGRKIVEIGSVVSPLDIARAMAEALGRPVRAEAVPRDQWTTILESFGMPPGRTGGYEEMIDGVNSGWIDFGVPDAERIPGTTTPAEVFAQIANTQPSS